MPKENTEATRGKIACGYRKHSDIRFQADRAVDEPASDRDVVTIARDRIRDASRKGQSLAQIKAAGIIRDYDGRYGAEKGPAAADAFLETAYRSSSEARPAPR